MAPTWWDPRGPMATLHKFNPVRLGYIRDQAAERFGRDAKKLDCLKGLRILDIGCGGGILSEPLARLGAQMVGVDPSRGEHRGRQRACRGERRRDRLSRHHGGGSRRRRRALRHRAGDGSGRARRRCRRLRRDLRLDGEAGRADDRRHLEPHAEELRAGHRRRRIRAALAAARHPSMGQVRHPERTRDRLRTRPACR